MSKIMYALPAFAGQLTTDDRHRMGAISRKVYDAVSHIQTLPLTKSSIAQTANCFPRLLNIDIVYTISSLPRLPHTAPTVFGKTVLLSFTSRWIFTV